MVGRFAGGLANLEEANLVALVCMSTLAGVMGWVPEATSCLHPLEEPVHGS